MHQLWRVFHDRPMTPQQTVVYWTEYVIRHGGAPHLKTAAKHLYWFQYYLLDVIGVFLASLITIIYISYLFISFVFSKCLRISRNSIIKDKTL